MNKMSVSILRRGRSNTRPPRVTFPRGTGDVSHHGTITVPSNEVFDGGGKRFHFSGIGDGGQGEGQRPAFILNSGSHIRDVVLMAPAGDGVHCYPGGGNILVENFWWDDVGEDGLTTKNKGKVTVLGGGARRAADKVFQLNADGGFDLLDFYAEDFTRLVRTNGGKNAKDLPYRVTIKNLVAYYGTSVFTSSNSKTRAKISYSDLCRIRHPYVLEGGARISERRVEYWD